MGYEITYTYHKKNDDGKYDTENTLELIKKVGKPFDDTPLEKVAAAILVQLARRDIWVIDVAVDELVRKSISYKESNGGIVLKGKKYSFDSAATLAVEDCEEEVEEVNVVKKEVKPPPTPGIDQTRVLMKMVYDPEALNLIKGQQLGYKVTVGNQYPIHQHKNNKYYITDDSGKICIIPEDFFVIPGRGLIGGFEDDPLIEKVPKPSLMYDGEYDLSVPNLRGRR